MSGLKEIRNRIKSVTSTQQITKAMKMVAAAKLRRAQERITALRPYAKKLNSVMARVSVAAPADVENVFSTVREEGKLLLVVITSDKGLCGGFNANVLKSTMSLLNNEYAADYSKGNYEVLPMGKKGAEFFARRKMNTVTTFTKTTENPTFESVKLVSAWVMEQFAEGKYAKVVLVYNEFKNVATQIIRNEQYLPLVPPAESGAAASSDYLFEPSAEYILGELVPKTLNVQLFKAVIDSAASEQGARMTAMDKATENAGELLKDLKLTYNRSRQAAITKEILEIVGGAEALAS